MCAYSKSISQVESELDTSSKGLTPDESKKRLETHGYNQLLEKKKRSKLSMFIDQFKDTLVVVLIIAAFISVVIAIVEHSHDWVDAIVIMIIVVFNAVFGYIQESRAEEALDALKAMSAPTATVLRGGLVLSMPAKNLVPGDLVHLEAGNKVPADIRLVESVSLLINEASLTGESEAVEKDADVVHRKGVPVGDRTNMAFSGCLVENGHGKGYVVTTGMNTKLGKIAGMIDEVETPPTPMQVKLEKLGKQIGIAVLGVC
ncbi:MAG TPA: ATPase, partial [Euryarchaeota archaeon]|nr:ATPase [Euryarchaeota archaeon]